MASEELTPIAIVGMSCRLPGDVSTPVELWRLLTKARSGWSKIPQDRFNQEAYLHPNPEKKGTINSQGGYFLKQDLTMFDAGFFDMTKKEAETMDPTQRLLLECAYEVLENAGIPKEKISGQKVGVYIGAPDCENRIGTLRDLDDVPAFDPTGNQGAFLAGRIAYYFNLRGPTFTMDTACSSSMHALHLAVQSIRNGESDSAIVGASHLITQPDIWVSMAKLRLFAESGKTHAFDHRAKSGYARGEGVGCIMVKTLDQALKDNDHIRAVITHTGLSHNGRTVGIVAPSSEEQERLVRAVLAQAKIEAKDIGFFEAHGTGTRVGDPIEATAIHSALGKGLTKREPLSIGSIKSNVGHLENASGIVSVMKAALMLEKGFIVPNADFERENPAIPLRAWNMTIPTQQQPWPRNKKYVCVNNFGYSGSNAHAVLQAAPTEDTETLDVGDDSSHILSKHLFVLSANDEAALRSSMEKLGIFLEQHAELYQTTMPRNLSYTLCQRRSHLAWRVAIVSDMCSALALALNSADAVPKRAPAKPPKIAFIFTGQGAQWHAMGRELMASHPTFLASIERSDKHLLSLGSAFSLLEELKRDEKETLVGQAHISQPICSAIQIGLVDLLASWGIKPSAVTGHSSGEIGAAYATGALTLEAAMSAAYHRGQAIIQLKKQHPDARGAMMAVGCGMDAAQPFFDRLPAGIRAVAACENSPSSTTVSGDAAAIDAVATMMAEEKIFNRKLFVDVAYHSPHMQLIAEPYHDAIAHIELQDTKSSVDFFSSLRARKISLEELGPQYWVENLTNPVRFATALQVLYKEAEPDLLIEVGPHAALKGPIMQTLKAMSLPAAKMPGYLSALSRGRDAVETTMELAGQLFMRGYEGLDFDQINHVRLPEVEKAELIPNLYTYPWSRQKCWYESRITRQHRLKPFARHDLIGTLADWSSDLEPTWRNFIRLEDLPWLRHYTINDRIVFPVSAYVSMLVEAAKQRASLRGVKARRFEMRDVVIKEQLYLAEEEPVEMMLTFRPCADATECDEFHLSSYESRRGWLEHCRGLVEAKTRAPSASRRGRPSKMRWQETTNEADTAMAATTATALYTSLASKDVVYPAAFSNLVALSTDEQGAKGLGCLQDTTVDMPHDFETKFTVHPAVIDPMFQITNVDLAVNDTGLAHLPTAIKQIQVELKKEWNTRPGSKFVVQSTTDAKSDTLMLELFAPPNADADADGPRLSMLGVQLTAIKTTAAESAKPRELCYKVQWEPTEVEAGAVIDQAHLKAHGQRVVLVSERDPTDELLSGLSKAIEAQAGLKPVVSTLTDVTDFSGFFIVLSELDRALLASVSKAEFKQVQKLITQAAGVMWVTRGASKVPTNPSTNMALGLMRTARSELSATAVTLDLDPSSKLPVGEQAALIEKAFRRTVLANDAEAEVEFGEENGKLTVPRMVPDDDLNVRVHRELGASAPYPQPFGQPGRQVQLSSDTGRGDGTVDPLDTLYFDDAPPCPALAENEIEVEVRASRLGHDDLGAVLDGGGSTGAERSCSGVVTRVGDKVSELSVEDKVCILAAGRLGSHVRAAATSAVRMAEGMSFEDAALIPSAYTTAYYTLTQLARTTKGERVMIQLNGDVGMAAIQVSHFLGADTFAVISTQEEREAATKSGMAEDHVLDANSMYFSREVFNSTAGHGMDVVFFAPGPYTSGTSKSKMCDCIAPFGRVFHIQTGLGSGKDRAVQPQLVENATFTSVNMLGLASSRPEQMRTVFATVMDGFRKADFHTLIGNATVLRLAELRQGLDMVKSSNMPPVVLQLGEGEQVQMAHASTSRLSPDGSHVIVGGTGGLGRSMARWMVQRGARHIVLLSRSGGNSDKVRELVHETADRATIVVKKCDVADEQQVQDLIGALSADSMPPICGLVHSAMVLQDGMFEEMTHEAYLAAVRSKVDGTLNLHRALQRADAKLDYMVLISSAAGVLGSRGQAAYAAANTFLDAFAGFRLANGLPAVALDLTAVSGAGYVAENAARAEDIVRNFGGETVSEQEVLALLAVATSAATGQEQGQAPPTAQWLTGLKLVPNAAGGLPYYAQDPRFAHLRAAAEAAALAAGPAPGQAVNYRVAFKSALGVGAEAARDVASRGILSKLGEVLSLAAADVDAARSIASFGLDSLTAIEVRNWMTRELGANLQILELLTSGCVADLAGLIVERVSGA